MINRDGKLPVNPMGFLIVVVVSLMLILTGYYFLYGWNVVLISCISVITIFLILGLGIERKTNMSLATSAMYMFATVIIATILTTVVALTGPPLELLEVASVIGTLTLAIFLAVAAWKHFIGNHLDTFSVRRSGSNGVLWRLK
jgi:hypothetical protein